MDLKVECPADLGKAVRAVRQSSPLRVDDFASIAGMSKQTAQNIELKPETVSFGLVMKALDQLGIRMVLEVSESAREQLQKLYDKEASTGSNDGRSK